MNILYLNNVMNVGGVEKCIIQLSRIMKDRNKVIVATAGGKLTDELDRINVTHYSILNTDSKNTNTILKNIFKIIDIIRREKIEIIHSHHRMTTLYCKIISKFFKFKLIHTQHLCIEDKFFFTRMVLKNIKIITVSNGAKQVLIDKCRLKEKDITTIYNTVETKSENKTVDENLLKFKQQGNFVIAQISRLVDYKGVFDFLNIVKKTVKLEENIRFVLIGDGPERNNIEERIKMNNLEEKLLLLGNKDNIITQLQFIDLVLLCSYVEGLPLVPLEAFSQGVPVIGTNIGGTNEEIIDDMNGYLIDKQDIDGFVNKIVEIYNYGEKYKNLCHSSRKVFEEVFNKEIYMNKHIDIYENQ